MTRSTEPRDDELTELEGLRRQLDPEHPDPDHLRQRIQLARRLSASTPHRRRRWAWGATPVLVAAVSVLVLVLAFALVTVREPLGERGFGPAGTPTLPAATTPPATSSPPLVPAGLRNCSASLGANAYCADPAECWAGVISVSNVPLVGTPESCRRSHVYQTFAAGVVDKQYRRQSTYEKLRIVRRLCSAATLSTVLGDNASAKRFEIIVLPPQNDSTTPVVRCLAGRGERKGPLAFTHQ